MKKENKEARRLAAFAPASPLRSPSMGRVDVKAFHDALAQRAARKQHENRALAQQLAASIARRASTPAISTAMAGRRRRSKPGTP